MCMVMSLNEVLLFSSIVVSVTTSIVTVLCESVILV